MRAPRIRPRKGKGIALATTLIFLMVLFIGATALGTISINNLTLRKMSSNSVVAMQAAEAGLAMVQAKLNDDSNFGKANESMTGSLGASNASWVVQFSNSASPGPSDSVNNVGNFSPVYRTDGSMVPPDAVDIIVSTNVQSPNRNIPKVGCILSNAWTTAIATSGLIRSKSSLQVFGASTLGAAQQILAVDKNHPELAKSIAGWLPGAIASNALAYPSVKLGSNSYYDSLTTPGTIDVPSGLPGAINGTSPVPKFTWSFYVPQLTAPNVQVLTSATLGSAVSQSGAVDTYYLDGSASQGGSLTLTNCTLCVNGDFRVGGSLTLINSTLYVNGNLVINGGIKDNNSTAANCTGSIYVCGAGHSVDVNGSSSMATAPDSTSGGYTKPQVAIYSAGNVTMSGQQTFEGIIYSDGDISISGGVQLVGLVIANGDTTADVGGGSDFEGSGTVVYCAPYAQAFANQAKLKMMKLSWRIIDTL